jgi:hypothetical protein
MRAYAMAWPRCSALWNCVPINASQEAKRAEFSENECGVLQHFATGDYPFHDRSILVDTPHSIALRLR